MVQSKRGTFYGGRTTVTEPDLDPGSAGGNTELSFSNAPSD